MMIRKHERAYEPSRAAIVLEPIAVLQKRPDADKPRQSSPGLLPGRGFRSDIARYDGVRPQRSALVEVGDSVSAERKALSIEGGDFGRMRHWSHEDSARQQD